MSPLLRCSTAIDSASAVGTPAWMGRHAADRDPSFSHGIEALTVGGRNRGHSGGSTREAESLEFLRNSGSQLPPIACPARHD